MIDTLSVLTLLFTVVVYGVGYHDGHKTVANECEQRGQFSVGAKTFSCTTAQTGGEE